MILRILITVVALLLLFLHRHHPSIATKDHFEMALLVVAILPWLAAVFKSVDIPGVGTFELQDLKNQLAETRSNILSVRQTMRGALSSLENRADAALQVLTPPAPERGNTIETESLVRKLNSLGELYVNRRNSLKKSTERTAEMSTIFGKMTAICAHLESFDPTSYLQSADAGKRLIAYASLYARPESSYLSSLVEIITSNRESTAFGQYWGIRALVRIAEGVDPQTVPGSLKNRLEEYCAQLPKDTDRYFELSKLAQFLEFGAPSDSL